MIQWTPLTEMSWVLKQEIQKQSFLLVPCWGSSLWQRYVSAGRSNEVRVSADIGCQGVLWPLGNWYEGKCRQGSTLLDVGDSLRFADRVGLQRIRVISGLHMATWFSPYTAEAFAVTERWARQGCEQTEHLKKDRTCRRWVNRAKAAWNRQTSEMIHAIYYR